MEQKFYVIVESNIDTQLRNESTMTINTDELLHKEAVENFRAAKVEVTTYVIDNINFNMWCQAINN